MNLTFWKTNNAAKSRQVWQSNHHELGGQDLRLCGALIARELQIKADQVDARACHQIFDEQERMEGTTWLVGRPT